MINLMAEVDSNLAAIAGKQAPFVASLALNRTAVGARDEVRGNLPGRFRLRNRYTVGGIQTTPSTKRDLTAVVRAPGYMAIQETGGTKRPTRSKLLAAPSTDLQGPNVIPKRKRPKGLADKAFVLDMKNGDAGIFIRYGKARRKIRLLWWLSDEQHYDERFNFEGDVRDYVQDRFSSAFIQAWEEALQGGGDYAASTSRGRGRQRGDRPEGVSARRWRAWQAAGKV